MIIYKHKYNKDESKERKTLISATSVGSSFKGEFQACKFISNLPWGFWAEQLPGTFKPLTQLGTVAPNAGRAPVSPGSAERGKPNERGSLQLIKNKWKQKSSPSGLLLILVVIHSQHVEATWGIYQMEKVEDCVEETTDCRSGPH